MSTQKGLQQARQNSLWSSDEDQFMVFDPTAAIHFRSDVGSDGNGLTNPQDWVTMQADGRSLADGTAMTGYSGNISRTLMPRYRHMERIWRSVSGLPTSDTLIDGGTRRKIVWNDPENFDPAIITETAFYGTALNAYKCMGGKLSSFNIDVNRDADGGAISGNIAYHYNDIDAGYTVPGIFAHNAKILFKKNGSAFPVIVRVGVNNGAAASGEVHTLTAVNAPVGDIVVYGNIVYNPSTVDNATFQTAIRAQTGRGGAVVSGTITVSGGSVTAYTLSGCSDGTYNGTYTIQGANYAGQPYFQKGTGTSARYFYYSGNNAYNTPYTAGWFLSSTLGDQAPPYFRNGGANSTPTQGTWTLGYGSSGTAPTNQIATNSGAVANGTLTITYLVASGDVGNIENAPGAGWQGAVSSPFSTGGWAYTNVTLANNLTAAQIVTALQAATGLTSIAVTRPNGTPYLATDDAFLVTVAAPASTKVSMVAVSGPKWQVLQKALGGAGTDIVYLEGPYLTAAHWRSYIATNDADLASIDMSLIPNDLGKNGDFHLMESCVRDNFSMADLFKGHYSGTGLKHAVDFVGGARTVAGMLTVPNDQSEGSDCYFLDRLQEGCLSPGFWKRRYFGCGNFEYYEDCYMGRSAETGFEVVNDAYMRSFPLVRRRNPEGTGSLRVTLILPVL